MEFTYSTRLLAVEKAAQAANATAAWEAATIPGLAPGNACNNATYKGVYPYKVADETQKSYNARFPGPSTPSRKRNVSAAGAAQGLATTASRTATPPPCAPHWPRPARRHPARARPQGPTSFQGTSIQDPTLNQGWSVEQPGMARTFWITS
jgi:hypothetical protein